MKKPYDKQIGVFKGWVYETAPYDFEITVRGKTIVFPLAHLDDFEYMLKQMKENAYVNKHQDLCIKKGLNDDK